VAMGDPFGHWLRTGGLAEIHLASGRAADALPLARRGHQLTQFVRSRGVEGWALRLVGEVEASQASPLVTEAQATYRQALARAEELGMRPLQGRCRLGLGLVHRTAGRPEEAEAELRAAAETFRALAMPYWLARAEAELIARPSR